MSDHSATVSMQEYLAVCRDRDALRDVFEVTLAGYWDWDIARNTEYLSPAFKRMFGYEDHELSNLPETWQKLIVPEDLPRVLDIFTIHVQSHGEIPYYSEVRYRHKDGSTVWVICAGRVVEWSPDGKPLRMVGCHIDITRRKETEEALRQARERLEQMADSINEVFWLEDVVSNRILYVSRAYERIWGRSCESLLHDPDGWLRAVHPDDRNAAMHGHGPGELILEYRIQRPDGEIRWVRSRRRPMPSATGQPVCFVGVASDITEARRREELQREHQQQLIHADKLASLGVLVSGVAHEINNPNNLIMLNTDVLMEFWREAKPLLEQTVPARPSQVLANRPLPAVCEETGELLTGIMHGTERIRTIVKALKDFVRVDKGALDETVDMVIVAQSALLIVANLIRKTTDHFSFDLADCLPHVKGNAQQLEQVLINLLTNACQALPDRSGSIELRVAASEDRTSVVVSVRDEGRGMEPDQLSHIMVPFYTTNRDSGGTGLGLPISYGIVQAHGGDLTYQSAPGKGTTATLLLPAFEPL
jgi:PAS domain S-box-containing protein